MSLVVLVAPSAVALAQDSHPLPYRTISLGGGNGGTLAVVEGEVRLVNSPSAWTEWTLQETDKGWTIRARLSQKAPAEAQFLSADGDGKVVLVAEPNDGAYWRLTRKGDRLTSFDAALQATTEKHQGWYLGFAAEPQTLEKGRLKYKTYGATLLEKPGARTALHIFIDGP